MSIEWRSWCRLCANNGSNGLNVFQNKELLLPEKVLKYLSIAIEREDDLPQTICNACSQRLGSFDSYAGQCLRVQAMFQAMLDQGANEDSKVELIREEFLPEEKHEPLDTKKDIELLAIDVDPFIPSDSSQSAVRKSKTKGGRKRTTKPRAPPRSKRTRATPKPAKSKKDSDVERRASSRIAQVQKDFALVSSAGVEVKVKTETLDEGDDTGGEEDEDKDEASIVQPLPKKRGRPSKALVGAAKRKAKIPRTVKPKLDEASGSRSAASDSDDRAHDNDLDFDPGEEQPNENEGDVRSENGESEKESEEDKADKKDSSKLQSIFRWECHVCNQVCPNWNSLSIHCRRTHQEAAHVVCLCAKVLASRASIIKHRLKHTNGYKYKCDKCDKAFHRRALFDIHKLSHVPKEEQPFVCCKCARRFHCEALLRQHERVHLPKEERLVNPCDICGKKFSSKSAVSAHLKAVHFGERPFVCDQCGHSFTSKGILQEHLTIHSDETPFKCTQCKKSFKTKYRLKIHTDTHRETPYQCPVCPLQLNTRRTLRMHLVVHKETKAYQCATCGKAFRRAKDLKNHHNLHTGRRPYTCTFCPRTFANGSNCRSHKRRMHPEELRIYEANLAAAENEDSRNPEDRPLNPPSEGPPMVPLQEDPPKPDPDYRSLYVPEAPLKPIIPEQISRPPSNNSGFRSPHEAMGHMTPSGPLMGGDCRNGPGTSHVPLNLNISELHQTRRVQENYHPPQRHPHSSTLHPLQRQHRSDQLDMNHLHHNPHPELHDISPSLNHLYQYQGGGMSPAVAAAIAHSGTVGVPAFPGNPYVHHNMGYNRPNGGM